MEKMEKMFVAVRQEGKKKQKKMIIAWTCNLTTCAVFLQQSDRSKQMTFLTPYTCMHVLLQNAREQNVQCIEHVCMRYLFDDLLKMNSSPSLQTVR